MVDIGTFFSCGAGCAVLAQCFLAPCNNQVIVLLFVFLQPFITFLMVRPLAVPHTWQTLKGATSRPVHLETKCFKLVICNPC